MGRVLVLVVVGLVLGMVGMLVSPLAWLLLAAGALIVAGLVATAMGGGSAQAREPVRLRHDR